MLPSTAGATGAGTAGCAFAALWWRTWSERRTLGAFQLHSQTVPGHWTPSPEAKLFFSLNTDYNRG